MLTLADTYRKTQILGHNIVIYSCISNLTLTVILHQNVKKNLRSYLMVKINRIQVRSGISEGQLVVLCYVIYLPDPEA